jgi:hypothetical protein
LLQRIDISRQRRFQEASCEPLGSDWGKAELGGIMGVRAANAAAIGQVQSNADPAVAKLRQQLACLERIAINLPEGEEREELRQGVEDLCSKAESFGVSAKLPLTQTRAGKVARRQNGRPEEQRLVTALHPSRQQCRQRDSLLQQQAAQQQLAEPEQEAGQQQGAGQQQISQQQQPAGGDAYPPLGKKGKATNKVSPRHGEPRDFWRWCCMLDGHCSPVLVAFKLLLVVDAGSHSARQLGRHCGAQWRQAQAAQAAEAVGGSSGGSSGGRQRQAAAAAGRGQRVHSCSTQQRSWARQRGAAWPAAEVETAAEASSGVH